MTEKLAPRTKLQVALAVAANILKKVPRIAFFSLAFFAIFWVGQQLYYGLMPGNHFLNYYYAKVDDTPVGTDPLATLCRRVSTEGITIKAFRTFIQYEDATGKQSVVGEYQFNAGVETGDSNCQNVRLKKQPQREGTYSVHTEYEFYVSGYRKTGSYDTNQYKMTPTTMSLQDQIQTLQGQIDILKSRLEAQGVDTSGLTPVTPVAPQSSTSSGSSDVAQPTTQAQQNPASPVQPTTPSTPITPADPVETCTVNLLGFRLLCRGT